MNAGEIIEIIGAKILCCQEKTGVEIKYAVASDLMSEVLTVEETDIILISSLSNIQIIRTAEILDIPAIVIVGGKTVSGHMIDLAISKGIIVAVSDKSMFRVCGLLHDAGLSSIN